VVKARAQYQRYGAASTGGGCRAGPTCARTCSFLLYYTRTASGSDEITRTASGSDENYTNCKLKIKHELEGWKIASTRTASGKGENYTNCKWKRQKLHELQVLSSTRTASETRERPPAWRS